MKRILTAAALCCMMMLDAQAQRVTYNVAGSGGLSRLQIEGDTCRMNWMMAIDGKQYHWMTSQYAWGLGFLTQDGIRQQWSQPMEKGTTSYLAGDIRIDISRRNDGDDLVETYTFTSLARQQVRLTDIAIFTPWNDNYGTAQESLTRRCNTHVWAGASAAWVKALRMGGQGSHLGLMVTRGAITDYEILQRGPGSGQSNERGVIALNLPDMTLGHEESYTLEWRIFVHQGSDFARQLLRRGGIVAESGKYVYGVGEEASVIFRSANKQDTLRHTFTNPGEVRLRYDYGDGRYTYADLLGISSTEQLIASRAHFIVDRQQMNDPSDPRYGAYMIYDNEGDSLLTWFPVKRGDLDESRERLGMPIFLARYYQKHPSTELLASLKRCAAFYHDKLQNAKTFRISSSVVMKNSNRRYNYSWMADFYFRMYDITGEREYARWGYETMRSLFRQFGYGFYAIDYPVTDALLTLKNARMKAESDSLLADYRRVADTFAATGLNFPKSEMNYEQAIIGPAVQLLSEVYLATREQRYLDAAREMLPGLESFNAMQPSYRMNDIAIRHWDGYWFGKRRQFGDVYPHYWSTITAVAFHYYALALKVEALKVKDKKMNAEMAAIYQQRAENIVLGNLSSFYEDGRATCAFLYPRRIGEQPARYADAYANDQDFALAAWFIVNEPIARRR